MNTKYLLRYLSSAADPRGLLSIIGLLLMLSALILLFVAVGAVPPVMVEH